MVVTATYNTGETKTVSNYTITNGNQLSTDRNTVTISYTEDNVTVSTTYTVEIIAVVYATLNFGFTPYIGRDLSYVKINGVTYTNNYLMTSGTSNLTLSVPVGTVVECGICSEYCEEGDDWTTGTVSVNNSTVFSFSAKEADESYAMHTYNYTVVGNAMIVISTIDHSCDCNSDSHHTYGGQILITES